MRVYYDSRGRRRGYSMSGGEAYMADVWKLAGMYIVGALVLMAVLVLLAVMVVLSVLGAVCWSIGWGIGHRSAWVETGSRMRNLSRAFHAPWHIAGAELSKRTPKGQMKRSAERMSAELSRLGPPFSPVVATKPSVPAPVGKVDWRVMLQCADGTEVLGDPRYATEREASLAAAKVRNVSGPGQPGLSNPVRSYYLIRTAADGRWTVMYDLGDGMEVPGTDRYPTPEEARAVASATTVLHVSGVPHRVRSYELVDSDSGPWRVVYECADGSEALGYGRYSSEATATRAASGTRTATVSGEPRAVRSYRIVREDSPVTRPTEPWFNEVAIELADLGLTERARNTGIILAGLPLQGDLALDGQQFSVFINLFANSELARQADLGLRAKPKVRNAIAQGLSAVKTVDRLVYTANGQGRVVDDFLLDEVILTVNKLSPPPSLETELAAVDETAPRATQHGRGSSVSEAAASGSDPLEQLRKLGELRVLGVLTDAEFEAKKATLLRQI